MALGVEGEVSNMPIYPTSPAFGEHVFCDICGNRGCTMKNERTSFSTARILRLQR